MPADAFVKFKDKRFYIREYILELISDYICQVFEQRGLDSYAEKLKKFYVHCNFAREGASSPMVNYCFDDYVDTSADVNALIAVLQQTQQLLSAKGDEISMEELIAFEKRKIDRSLMTIWFAPVETQYLVDALDLMVQMLNETLQQSNFIF